MINQENIFYEVKKLRKIMTEFYLIRRNLIIYHKFIISFIFLLEGILTNRTLQKLHRPTF